MATPVTQAPPRAGATRQERYEAVCSMRRCWQCHHFIGNHDNYMFNSKCRVCDCA